MRQHKAPVPKMVNNQCQFVLSQPQYPAGNISRVIRNFQVASDEVGQVF
jgi:hypothetical protein